MINSRVFNVAVLMMAGRVLSLLSLLVYSFYLSAEDYGKYSIIVSAISVLAMVIQFGGQNYFLKEASKLLKSGNLRSSIKNNFLISVFILSVVCLPLDMGWFGPVLDYLSLVVVVVLVMGLCWLNNYSAIARVFLGASTTQWIESVARYGLSIIGFFCAFFFFEDKLKAGILGLLVSITVPLFILVVLVGKKSTANKNNTKKDFSFYGVALPIYFLSLARLLSGEGVPLMISGMVEIEKVGVFRFYTQLIVAASFPLVIVNYYYAPLVAKYFSDGGANCYPEIRRASLWGAVASLIFVLCSYCLLLWNPGEIIPGHFSSEPFSFLIVGLAGVANVYFGPIGVYLVMAGKASVAGISVLIAGLTNVAFLLFLVPEYGLNGAAVSMFLATMVLNIMMLYFSREVMNDD